MPLGLRAQGVRWCYSDFNYVTCDGLLVASVPALPGCHAQASSHDELMSRIREAIALHLQELGGEVAPLEFVAIERVSVTA